MPLNKWGVNLCELNYGGGNKVNEVLFLYFLCTREDCSPWFESHSQPILNI